ncbi:hypothetical protein HGO21_03255 [Acinetobacter sp. CUI P1]|nr:hypothetical protein [Acinetobacter sp. CUI P1]
MEKSQTEITGYMNQFSIHVDDTLDDETRQEPNLEEKGEKADATDLEAKDSGTVKQDGNDTSTGS